MKVVGGKSNLVQGPRIPQGGNTKAETCVDTSRLKQTYLDTLEGECGQICCGQRSGNRISWSFTEAGGWRSHTVGHICTSVILLMQDGKCGGAFFVLRAKGWPDHRQGFTSSCAQAQSQEELRG